MARITWLAAVFAIGLPLWASAAPDPRYDPEGYARWCAEQGGTVSYARGVECVVSRSPSGMPGMGSTGDPMMDLMMPVLEQGMQAIGQEIGRSIFGDPAAERQAAELRRLEEQRLEELRRAEEERLAEIRRREEAEQERQRQERHRRVLGEMVLLDTAPETKMLELDDEDLAPAIDFDGGGFSQNPPLLGLDDELAPAGTGFFGEGGAGLPANGDTSVVDLRAVSSYGAVQPIGSPTEAGSFGGMIEVPVPYIEGNAPEAKHGRQALQQVADLQAEVASLTNIDQTVAHEELNAMRRSAEMIAHYDKIMNELTRRRVESMSELTVTRAAAIKTRDKFVEDSLTTLGSALGAFRKAGKDQIPVGVWDELSQALDLQEDIQDQIDCLRSLQEDTEATVAAAQGREIDADSQAKLFKRGRDLALKLTEADKILSRVYDEETAEQILGRAGPLVSSVDGVRKSLRHTMDMLLLHQETAFLNDDLGDAARQLGRLQESRAKQIREYHERRHRIEAVIESAGRTEQARSNSPP